MSSVFLSFHPLYLPFLKILNLLTFFLSPEITLGLVRILVQVRIVNPLLQNILNTEYQDLISFVW